MDIKIIRGKVKNNEHQFTLHSLEKMVERKISDEEIKEAILNGEIIEEYADDNPFPSCLIYGVTKKKRNLHLVCSTEPEVWIITTYEPDETKWITFKVRKVV